MSNRINQQQRNVGLRDLNNWWNSNKNSDEFGVQNFGCSTYYGNIGLLAIDVKVRGKSCIFSENII